MDGEPANAETTLGATATADGGQAQVEGTQEEGGKAGDPAIELAALKERYKHSSEEGLRLHNELKEAKDRLSRLENSSLKQQQQQQGQQPAQAMFPDKQSYIKYWTEHGEKTEKEASAEYDRERFMFDSLQQLRAQQDAILAKQKFDAMEREASLAMTNPEAKAAVDFFKDDPILDSLPVSEKIQRYNRYVVANKPKVEGRDLSAIKGAAGSTVGGAAKASASVTAEEDAMARNAGFPSMAAMRDFNNVKTAAEHAQWKTKWKVK